jgi:hypothetical protein
MTVMLPRMPAVFRFRRLIAASTSGMALRIGKGEIASSSRTQKCPPMDVTAGGIRARRRRPSHQPSEDLGLAFGVMICEVSHQVTHIGVHDGQIRARTGGGMPVDQAAIVILGRGRTDSTDQANVLHGDSIER